jgi:rhodanese-related sulfurtransferase
MVRIFGRTYDQAPVPAISVRELKRRLDQGEEVVVVDVRQPAGYDAYPGTIPGSVRIPPTVLPERYQELPRDRALVLFCT